jgi:type IV pilus assembly protein PilO
MALTKLPDEREIPGLLYAVAQAGKDAGINFILFEPKPVEKKPPDTKPAAAKPGGKKMADAKDKAVEEKFYEEIPVKVAVVGGFHNTAVFFEKVARLPRIVNIEDIAMSEGKDMKGRGRYINTACVIKTYMFLEKMGEKKTDEKK